MKVQFLVAFTLITSLKGYSQTINYSSSSTLIDKREFVFKKVKRDVTLTDKQITVSNFIEGVKLLVLTINKIEKKKYKDEGICKWYYYDPPIEHFNEGNTKYLVIIKDIPNPDTMNLFQIDYETWVWSHVIFIERK